MRTMLPGGDISSGCGQNCKPMVSSKQAAHKLAAAAGHTLRGKASVCRGRAV
ncbi:MAG: hypothetical protein OSJ64_05550 [Firmicutes bacterium]|nr:hypothetical protein [Bacillota bacterium]